MKKEIKVADLDYPLNYHALTICDSYDMDSI